MSADDLELPRIGISFPTPVPVGGQPVTGGTLVEGAQRIEALGFHGIWMADVIARGYFSPDPLVALAAVAGATQRVELGTCIVQVPLAHPAELARRALTTALAADGRFVLGVGAGSTRGDFDAVDEDYDSRFKAFEQSLSIMTALWNSENVGNARLDPWPALNGGPPVLIGSWGGKWVARAATEFDGWIGSGAHRSWAAVEEAV